jgi:hypothetical protein
VQHLCAQRAPRLGERVPSAAPVPSSSPSSCTTAATNAITANSIITIIITTTAAVATAAACCVCVDDGEETVDLGGVTAGKCLHTHTKVTPGGEGGIWKEGDGRKGRGRFEKGAREME